MELSRPLATVTPTLDGDVLAALARTDAAFTTGELHRTVKNASEEGVRKVLHRLTRQGVVRSTRVGNAHSYQLNRDHLAAQHIIGLARLPNELLKRTEDRLSSWAIPPVYAAVFGSAATGSMTVDSDLDLILIYPANADHDLWRAQVDELAADVTRWTGNDARPVEFAETNVSDIAGQDRDLFYSVADEGLTVAGSRDWFRRQIRGERS
jgi:predicted nucleotidyltransferase